MFLIALPQKKTRKILVFTKRLLFSKPHIQKSQCCVKQTDNRFDIFRASMLYGSFFKLLKRKIESNWFLPMSVPNFSKPVLHFTLFAKEHKICLTKRSAGPSKSCEMSVTTEEFLIVFDLKKIKTSTFIKSSFFSKRLILETNTFKWLECSIKNGQVQKMISLSFVRFGCFLEEHCKRKTAKNWFSPKLFLSMILSHL